MTRRRAPALAAPQTMDQAMALLGRFATLAGEIARTEAERDAAVAEIKGRADILIVPRAVEQTAIVKQLAPWWSVVKDELTGGKRKSIELGGCLIGERTANPSLAFNGKKIDKNSEDVAIDAIEGADGLDHFLRISTELEKQLLLRALGAEGDEAAETAAQLTALGFSARQPEQFFVDRLPPKPTAVADVTVQPDEVSA